ncbi:MAG: hypothetical protein ACE5E6_00700 [Phycisphaerae bacterium]
MPERPADHPVRKRPSVRVKGHPINTLALLSLVIAAGAALFVYGAWRLWRVERPSPPPMRTLGDVAVDWRCPRGHRFRAPGAFKPQPCRVCGELAEATDRYVCREHGAFDVAVRFGHGPGGRARPSLLRIGKGRWTPAKQGVRCPRCHKVLRRPGRDPLAHLREP